MGQEFKITEKLLIKGLSTGDQQCYKIIFDTYNNWLCNYVCKLSNDMDLSKDLVQNVMLRLWEKKESLEIKTSLKSYLFRACHNEFLMHIRKQKKQIDLLDQLKLETLYDTNNVLEENLLESYFIKIEKAIELLPTKCKKVFKLSRFEQKRNKEIAKLLGISSRTVEVHIRKAIKLIKAQVSRFLF
ncbi:RNA polymerase sigma factor [Aquimarina sp. 2201CG14-23]|uniref:RNA polymerase sigma factor n=1 Tax=Aquimarina mycalae TaxID=3040073 RepID=UPI002477DBDB|nr:RNA polymerase sigma-70 factor [Aquimarina sp. 2201CG14-23]MDH7444305.1 RNA polymerase sigma-70 factor [Aquimarina sp. 2201CG14-23]